MCSMSDPAEKRGEHCGRIAGEKFRAAAADGVPSDKVAACRPLPGLAAQAEQMLGSDEPSIRASGRFWLTFLAEFSATFPEFFSQ
jgi:hypothetical protein